MHSGYFYAIDLLLKKHEDLLLVTQDCARSFVISNNKSKVKYLLLS